MIMKRIGILTFWGVPNYGAWAQAYALNNIVRNIVNNDDVVLHLNYLNQTHFNLYYRRDEKLYNTFWRSWNKIPHTERLNETQLEELQFDTVILGSDSIWEFSLPEMGDDIHLIGNQLSAHRIVSYATSAGITNLADEKKEWIKRGLEKIDFLSVRDKHTLAGVEKITGTHPELVLDPALLWDWSLDKNVCDCVHRDYIAVYGSEWTDEFIFEARKYARQHGYKLISLGWINPWCDFSYKMNELRTLEWVGMIRNASGVFTSTFHGLMLGIKMQKQVKFCQIPYVKNRSNSLLDLAGDGFALYQQETLDYNRIFDNQIDYDVVNGRLVTASEKSLDFLRRALLDV